MPKALWHPAGHKCRTVYLAGPMSGFPDMNKPVFDLVAREIGELYDVEVVNPAKISEDLKLGDCDADWVESISSAVKRVAGCDAMIMMDPELTGRMDSTSYGVEIERNVAHRLDIPVFRYGKTGFHSASQQPALSGLESRPMIPGVAPPNPLVIGFTGLAHSGKDTAAEQFVRDWGAVRVALADPIKRFLLAVNPLCWTAPRARVRDVIDRFGYDTAKADYPEIRVLLRRIGTDGPIEAFGHEAWTKLWTGVAIREIESSGSDATFVVPDVRFDHEARIFEERFRDRFVLLQIERSGIERMDHASEAGVSVEYIHETIPNDGTVQELADKCMSSVIRAMCC